MAIPLSVQSLMTTDARQPKRCWLRITFMGVGVVAASILICRLFAAYGFSDTCTNDHFIETFSPNGELKVVTFRRNCGATTDFSTRGSILKASGKLPKSAGNVFVSNHEQPIVAHWVDDRHLRFSKTPPGDVRLRITEFKGVQITYE